MVYFTRMKKKIKDYLIRCAIVGIVLFIFWSVCFYKKQSSANQIEEMMSKKETFVVFVDKEGCGYCEDFEEYIALTKMFHPFHVVYQCDFYEIKKLDTFAELRYTPSVIKIEDGEVVLTASGFDSGTGEMAIYKTSVNIEESEAIKFWNIF